MPGRRHRLAVLIGKIATGELENEREKVSSAAAEIFMAGGKKRAENWTPERPKEIAGKAAAKRWQKDLPVPDKKERV